MEIWEFLGSEHLLIGVLGAFGVVLLVISGFVHQQVHHRAVSDDPRKEKRLEYYRNTFSQLGIILIGIGISLSIFFFEKRYEENRKHEAEVRQVLAKLAYRLSRSAAVLEYLPEYDALLDAGTPYVDPGAGGRNKAVTAGGADLAKEVSQIAAVERDVDLESFADLRFSEDLQASTLTTEIEPHIWFTMLRDENDLEYATTQLKADFGDLRAALGDADPEKLGAETLADPKVKREVLDIFYDMDMLRDRSRRVVARACWFLSQGDNFLTTAPLDGIEKRYKSHQEWLDQAKTLVSAYSVGGEDCFSMLSYKGSAPVSASALGG